MKVSRFLAALFAASLCGGGYAVAQKSSALFGATLRPEQIPVVPAVYMTKPVSQTPTGYTPAQVAKAYGKDHLSGTGSGQTIALIEFHGSSTLQKDLDTFSEAFSLSSTTVAVYAPQGQAGQSHPVWALQTTLDVEWAHAAAPDASIMVVLAKNDRLSSMLDAVDYAVQKGATQVVMNWGGAEFSAEKKYDTHFQVPGVTFVAASGDAVHGLQWPATSPNVVSVGGTTLKLDEKGNINSEIAWTYSNGGSSVYEPVPTWQSTWQNTQGRGVPDVSFLADPDYGVAVYMSHYGRTSGWFTVGGSGVGAVQWAGLYAIAGSGTTGNSSGDTQQGQLNSNSSQQNTQGQNKGKQGNSGKSSGGATGVAGGSGTAGGNGNKSSNNNNATSNVASTGQNGNSGSTTSSPVEVLYRIATASYSTDFRDITTGGNGTNNATDGYDFVTGLGSPIADALVLELQSK